MNHLYFFYEDSEDDTSVPSEDNNLIIRDDTAVSRDSMNSTNSFSFELFTDKANQLSSDAKLEEDLIEQYTIAKSFEDANSFKPSISVENQIRSDLGETYLFESQVNIDSDLKVNNGGLQGKILFGIVAVVAIGLTLFLTLKFRKNKRRN